MNISCKNRIRGTFIDQVSNHIIYWFSSLTFQTSFLPTRIPLWCPKFSFLNLSNNCTQTYIPTSCLFQPYNPNLGIKNSLEYFDAQYPFTIHFRCNSWMGSYCGKTGIASEPSILYLQDICSMHITHDIHCWFLLVTKFGGRIGKSRTNCHYVSCNDIRSAECDWGGR